MKYFLSHNSYDFAKNYMINLYVYYGILNSWIDSKYL